MSNWDISTYSVKRPVRLLLHKRQRLLIVHVGQCLAWWRWFALLKVDCHRDWMELFHNPYPYHPCTVNRPIYIYLYCVIHCILVGDSRDKCRQPFVCIGSGLSHYGRWSPCLASSHFLGIKHTHECANAHMYIYIVQHEHISVHRTKQHQADVANTNIPSCNQWHFQVLTTKSSTHARKWHTTLW